MHVNCINTFTECCRYGSADVNRTLQYLMRPENEVVQNALVTLTAEQAWDASALRFYQMSVVAESCSPMGPKCTTHRNSD